MPINPLDVPLGIQSVLDMRAPGSMPNAQPLAVSLMREAGLDSLHVPASMTRMVESALCPDVGDGDIARPDIFNARLREAAQQLKSSDNPIVQTFLHEDLQPLMENHYLQQAYLGLLIGG